MARLSVCWLTILILHSTVLLAQSPSHTTPPAPYSVTVTQPDGQALTVINRGSAYHHWIETADGYTIIKNPTGYYEYATTEQGKLVTTGLSAVDPSERSLIHQRQLLRIPKRVSSQRNTIWTGDPSLRARTNNQTNSAAVVPTEGDVRLLAILIEYPDLKHKYETEDFEKLLNGPSDKPTFKQYFRENSHGKFNPTVDVVGWYQAKNNYEYYGEKHGKGRARELVNEALKAAEADGVDFSQYDNTGNRNIDGVMIVHSGQGDEEGGGGDYIWSHRSSISSLPLIGGSSSLMFAKDYTIQPEIRVNYNDIVGIGIFCHEFGHLLGLPDLYDTDTSDDEHYGIGEWGLMGLGGWLGQENYPAGMSAFSKEKLGWANIKNITENVGSYELQPAHRSGEIYKITTNNNNEYFLLENRQKAGTDEYLNGVGMAIWHINSKRTDRYPASIHVNNRRDSKGVDLEEADGDFDLDFERNRGDAGDLFPGSHRRTIFDNESDPNSQLYEDKGEGVETGIAITNIQLDGTTIQFDFNLAEEEESGSSCEVAVEAQEGENTSPTGNYWYTFTLPTEGKLVIQEANATVFSDCDASEPLATSTDGQLTTSWLRAGEVLKIKLGEKQSSSFPLIWKLTVDTHQSDPELAVEPIAPKTYGDSPFNLSVSYRGTGAISYQKIAGPIELAGNEVSIIGAGTGKIKVILDETDEYAADEKEIEIQINRANTTLSVSEVEDKVYGDDPFLLQASTSPDFPIAYTVKKGSVSLDDGKVTIEAAGEVEIEAAINGNSNYEGARKTIAFTVQKASQTISFSELDDLVFEPGKEIELLAVSDWNLPVTFSVLEGGVALEEQTMIVQQAGTITIEARQAGNKNIESAPAVRQSFEIAKAPQNISFAEIGNKTVEDEPFALEAASDAGISMEFVLISGNATLDQNQVTLLGGGEVIVEAFNEGNENYRAVKVRQSFIVAEPDKENQEITTATLPDTVIIDEVIDLEISVSSGLNPDIDLVGAAIRNNQTLTFAQPGEVTLTVRQPGNEEYNPAPTITHTFVVVKLPETESPLGTRTQTITYNQPENITFGDIPFPVPVENSSSLPVTYTIDGPAEISNGLLTIMGVGEVTIRAFQPGNEEYAPSDTVIFTFNVSKASQKVSLEVIPTGKNTFQIRASSNSDLPVTVDISEGKGNIEGDILTVESAQIELTASQAGNENFEAAEPVVKELMIELITSIGSEVGEHEVVIFPNPSEGEFRVALKAGQNRIAYQVFDLQGVLVSRGTLQPWQPLLDLSSQPSGTYFVQMQLAKHTKRIRLIKR